MNGSQYPSNSTDDQWLIVEPSNADDDLIEVPDIVSAGLFAAQMASEIAPELLSPFADRLVKDNDTAFQQHLLDPSVG